MMMRLEISAGAGAKSLRAGIGGSYPPPTLWPPAIIPPGCGRQQWRREKQWSPARSEQPCRAARSSRTLGKDRSQLCSLKVPSHSSMGNFHRRKRGVPGAWGGRQDEGGEQGSRQGVHPGPAQNPRPRPTWSCWATVRMRRLKWLVLQWIR